MINSVVSPARQEAAARRAQRKKEGRKIVMASDWKHGVVSLLPCWADHCWIFLVKIQFLSTLSCLHWLHGVGTRLGHVSMDATDVVVPVVP